MRNSPKRWAFLFTILLSTAGCQGLGGKVTQEPLRAEAPVRFDRHIYESIPSNQGRVFWIDSQASEVRLFIWRGGPMAAKGHNHLMRVTNMEGAVFLPNDMLQNQMRFDIVFPVSEIEMDPLNLRRELGGAFNTGLTEKGAQDTREHMLSARVLDAQNFPTIGLGSTKTYGETPKMAFDIQITIRGVSRHYLVPITISMQGNQIRASGVFAIEQTNFGIEPYSAMGGALYILDPVMIEFNIIGQTR